MKSKLMLAFIVAAGGFLGWLAASGNSEVAALAQETSAKPRSADAVLPFTRSPSASVAGFLPMQN